MKFSVKIVWAYICIYLMVMIVVGITVTENSYQSIKEQEISRSVDEEQNIYSSIMLYLVNIGRDEMALVDYSNTIVDLFSGSNSYLEVFDDQLQLVATNSPAIWNGTREEVALAATGQRNFVLRHDEMGRYYLFICNYVEMDQQGLVISTVKDISHLDSQRNKQYLFFLEVGLMGLMVVTFVVVLLSRVLFRPIKELDQAAQNIAAGNYNERVKITSNDEIGSLAVQFNLMAAEVEGKIQQMETESYRQQRFVDNLTHELRTPLTSIIGYAELLQKVNYQPELFKKGLGYIYDEGRRMLNLNKVLMDLTFYREEELIMGYDSILILCQEVQEMETVKAQTQGVGIEVMGEAVYLWMERDMIKSLLINLVDNSLKASESGSTITIRTSENETEAIVVVADQGRGMAQKELEKIREPFYRVDKARSRADGGLGLGVAICNQIIVRHNGRMVYESEPGAGTTVCIYLPKESEFHG